ncbi:hypothetical protein [Nannocystis pusilla]|uniref:hypothetical protein n=1 Tax=Nannocystis pusilla TaxID=889268 RepID=UPI003B80B51A
MRSLKPESKDGLSTVRFVKVINQTSLPISYSVQAADGGEAYSDLHGAFAVGESHTMDLAAVGFPPEYVGKTFM